MTTAVQHSFGGGEIAPVIYSRVDTQKYASGCKTLKNNLITRSGAMMNRSGTLFAGEVKDSTKTVRLIPFQFSNSQSYALEFGDLYVRFYQNGNQVKEIATNITAATSASPGVFTSVGHGYSTGDEIFTNGFAGTIGNSLNNRNWKVVKLTADTYSLLYMDSSVLNTTTFGAYTSGGTAQRIYTVTTIYPYNVLSDLKFVQSADVMTFTHPSYPIQQLSRTNTITNGINVWSWTTFSLNPKTVGPINGSITTQNEVLQGGGSNVWAQFGTGGAPPTSGSIKLIWQGSTSVAIAYNASAATIQAAINTILVAVAGAGASCSVSGTFNSTSNVYVAFTGTLAATKQPTFSYANGFVFTSGFRPMLPMFAEVQQGGTSTSGTGSNTYKYKVTSIASSGGEESLPGLNGSIGVSFVSTRGTNGTICQITTSAVHNLSSGDEITFSGMTAAGVAELDGPRFIVTVLDTSNFILNGIDSTTFGVYSYGAIMQYTSITVTSAAVPTKTNPITLLPGGVNVDPTTPQVGLIRIYKQINGIWGYVGTVKPGTAFLDTNIPPDVTIQPPQFQTLFSSPGNYPSCVTYYQQRLCFANTNNVPMGFWASKVGNFNNFSLASPGLPVADNDAVIFELASEKIDPIKNLINVGNLIVLTENSEFAILGNNTGGQYGTITPTAINATLQSHHGAASLRPILVQGSAVYLQARSSIIRDLMYQLTEDKYKGNDLTTFATHMFDTYTIVDMDYQQVPNSYIWCVRSDGTLLSLTYNREQEIFAWSRHDTSGTFENVCVIPENNTDTNYVVSKRLVITNGTSRYARYVETFQPRNVEIGDPSLNVFSDCSGIFDGSNSPSSSLRGSEADLFLTKGFATSATNAALNAASPSKITVRGWCKLNGDNFNNGLMTRSSLASSQGDWALGFFTGGTNQLVFRVNGLNQIMSAPLSKGIWHFVEANYDSGAPAMRLFVDGVLVASRTDYSTVISNNSNGLAVGTYYDSSGNWAFNGEMSEWEFCSNYIRNTSAYTPPTTITVDGNTTVCYHMNDGQGSTLADSSGNAINATLYGIYHLGASKMTVTGGVLWNTNEQLTMTCSGSYFLSTMVGDDIRVKQSDGTFIKFKITAYTSSTVVTVMSSIDVPSAYKGVSFSNWARATKEIYGLWFLENHAVSVLANGYVMASPRNLGYNLLVVSNGHITLPENSSYAIIGCPYVSDFKSLDVDVVGYSVFMGKTTIDKWKNISETTAQVVNSRGGFGGNETPEDNIQNTNNDALFQLYEMKSRAITTNANLPPALVTDNIKITTMSGWDLHGNVFIRQVDPLPLCLSQIAFAGDIPLRDSDTAPPKGAQSGGR